MRLSPPATDTQRGLRSERGTFSRFHVFTRARVGALPPAFCFFCIGNSTESMYGGRVMSENAPAHACGEGCSKEASTHICRVVRCVPPARRGPRGGISSGFFVCGHGPETLACDGHLTRSVSPCSSCLAAMFDTIQQFHAMKQSLQEAYVHPSDVRFPLLPGSCPQLVPFGVAFAY